MATPRYYRKVIRIRAEDSPNVRYGLAQVRAGIEPTNEILVPGVLTYADYVKRRKTWDPIRQCIGLDAQFYEGAEILLFPPEWLNLAEIRAEQIKGLVRKARAIGIDPAEGGDKTAMAAVDELGIIELVSKKTSNTAVIPREAIAFGAKHGVAPENWVFDRGGGGKQHADTLREQGYAVRTVAFGESISLDPKRGLQMVETRMEMKEDKYVFLNRRAQLYGEFSQLLDPGLYPDGFGLASGLCGCVGDPETELRHQLAQIPKKYDKEGRLVLLPKHNPNDDDDPRTLVKLIGHSPDEADAVSLAIHGMLHKKTRARAGVIK